MTSPDATAYADLRAPHMEELAADDFPSFFSDVYGVNPFPWQQRLTTRVLTERTWPAVLDLPTGTGKTAVLDTAIFAMAAQPDIAPRRVVFVVDRRIVVDQVYERARRLRSRIETGATSILRRVRSRLQALSNCDEPLGLAALRGGIPIDSEWTHRPDQPWVVVSTVDQFGSRLLFRGYGVKPGMWPVHAGLAGNDCLVILDEVHLSIPFAETLDQITLFRCGPLPHRFAVVEMSATPNNIDVDRFAMDHADLEDCPELRRRVTAPKVATLQSVRNESAVPAKVLTIIRSLSRDGRRPDHGIRSIGVIVNRVRTAREVYQALAASDYAAHLITGRMRPLDRVGALRRIGPIVDPDGHERGNDLAIVVSTQAIEVGADFSFDALITECAPVDSLRQRFGRLDRRGTYAVRAGSAAKAWIIGLKSIVSSKMPDAIYGNAVRATWEELQFRAARGPLDVGPTALDGFPEGANAPRDHSPLLLRTYLDAWSQTSPQPIVQPSVERFLHGLNHRYPADVSIVWRRDTSSEALRLVPPRPAELLQVPISAVRSWLSGATEIEVADVPQTDELSSLPSPSSPVFDRWVRWGGSEDGAEPIQVREIRPGDVLVAGLELGGLSSGNWDPSSRDPVSDLGDEAQLAYQRRVTLRLDGALSYVDSPPTPADDDVARPLREHIAEWIENWTAEADRGSWIRVVGTRLGTEFQIVPIETSDSSYYVLIERHVETKKQAVDPGTMDGGDEASSLTGTSTPLRSHLHGVSERAEGIAARLNLPISIRRDLGIAGRLHDIGKVDRRFQLQLVGGDPIEMEMLDHPIAKSLPGARRVRRYPTGMRHELASVAMIESNYAVLSSANDRDLVLHLIATHHGWARPLPPIIEDPNEETLSFTLDGHKMTSRSDLAQGTIALDVADRYWRLVRRYGHYGLVWLEAILRLADHQQSADESKR